MADPDTADLAQDRTELAEDRTVLAHERSFAAWLRTGMAAVGIGLGFNALFDALQPAWLPRAIASAFLLIAVFIFVSAQRRALRIQSRLQPHQVRALRPVNMRVLAIGLVTATIGLGIGIWML